jgi:hypothetical protein
MSTYTAWDPHAPPASPHALSTEFDGDTAGFDAAFTKVNWPALGYSVNQLPPNGTPGALYAEAGQGSNYLQRHALLDLPAGDFLVAAHVEHHGTLDEAQSSFVGISLADGTTPGTGSQVCASLEWDAGKDNFTRWCGKYAGFQGASTASYHYERCHSHGQYLWLKRTGSVYSVGFSQTGVPGEENGAVFAPGFTPTKYGVWFRNDSTKWICVSWSFLRYFDEASAVIGGYVVRELAP